MADTANTRRQRPDPEANADPAANAVPSGPDLGLFTPDEVARLQELRDLIEHGRVGELTGDYKRLLFARWLYQQGKLEG